MRHRIILNFEAQAESIEPDKVLLELLEKCRRRGEIGGGRKAEGGRKTKRPEPGALALG